MTNDPDIFTRLAELSAQATPDLRVEGNNIVGRRLDGDVASDGFGNVAEMFSEEDEDRATCEFLAALAEAYRSGQLVPPGEAWRAGAHAMREVAECMVAEAVGAIERRLVETTDYDQRKQLRHTSGALMNMQAAIRNRPLPQPPADAPLAKNDPGRPVPPHGSGGGSLPTKRPPVAGEMDYQPPTDAREG